jgi:hypothetical protein
MKGGETMKHIPIIAFVATIVAIALISGCKKDTGSEGPVSYGETYTGDFFPLRTGYVCNYSGYGRAVTTATIPGYGSSEDSTSEPLVGMLKVLAIRNIPLPSGTVPLYPIVDMTGTWGQMEAVYDTSRFFMKDAEAVYLKAIKLASGDYMEIQNPVYVKNQLVVGDAWETAPRMDITKLLETEAPEVSFTDLNLDAKANFRVIGIENISLPIGTRNAIRLDQANDISMNGTMVMEGIAYTLNMTAPLAVVYHFLADTGIVHQNLTGPIDLNVSAQGQTLTIKIVFNQWELKLTSLGESPYAKINSNSWDLEGFVKSPTSFKTQTQGKMWRAAQKIVGTLIRSLSLQ